jgi:hypothetical protein
MKLRYHIATISFCPDLLNPEAAASVPVGVLLVGESSDQAVALLAVNREPALPAGLPDVVREIVGQFPLILQAQLESILHSDAGRSIDSIMREFEDSLRNSFYLSDLHMNQVVEAKTPKVAVRKENLLYEPFTNAAAASIAAQFEHPWAMDYRYRPWATVRGAGGDRHVQ